MGDGAINDRLAWSHVNRGYLWRFKAVTMGELARASLRCCYLRCRLRSAETKTQPRFDFHILINTHDSLELEKDERWKVEEALV